jgi:hypothetical protein
MSVYDQYPKIIRCGKRTYSKEGGSCELLIRVKVPHGWSRKMIADWAHGLWDTWCLHSYDCCGYWYNHVSSHRMFRHKGREWLIPVTSVQNV